jgi:hypothetical protein
MSKIDLSETAAPAVGAPLDCGVVRLDPERASKCGLTECKGKPMCRRCHLMASHERGFPKSSDERYLRRLLAHRVSIPGAYYDDGEAHGSQHGITIDFMREPVADIDAKLRALNVARAQCSMGLCAACGAYHKPGGNPLCTQ